MKLTFRKLLFATVVIILLDIAFRDNYGLTGWISPTTLKFWVKDLALLLAWGIYLIEKRKK